MTAPVCVVQPDTSFNQPSAKPYPPIPVAHDLQSALNAINAMRNMLQHLFNMQSANNASSKAKTDAFTEVQRTTEIVRVYNPSDSSQWVDVQMITSLTMGDKKTGDQWTWKR